MRHLLYGSVKCLFAILFFSLVTFLSMTFVYKLHYLQAFKENRPFFALDGLIIHFIYFVYKGCRENLLPNLFSCAEPNLFSCSINLK